MVTVEVIVRVTLTSQEVVELLNFDKKLCDILNKNIKDFEDIINKNLNDLK